MNEQAIYEALLDIKQTVGEVHATAKSLESALLRHVQDDERVEERVREVELAQAKHRGALKVWSLVAAGAGAIIGFLVDWFR